MTTGFMPSGFECIELAMHSPSLMIEFAHAAGTDGGLPDYDLAQHDIVRWPSFFEDDGGLLV